MNVDLALSFPRFGFNIVPVHYLKDKKCTCGNPKCPSPAKHPFPSKWQDTCSNRPEEIKAWWRAFKSPNAGIVTGQKSGVVVLDIDPRHGGMDSLDDLQVKHGKLPDTAIVQTGSGGFHYYFKDPKGLKNGTNIGGNSGIDFRGDNGFVVSPGSTHANGNLYDWYDEQTPDVGFAELPKWLYDLVYKPPVSVVKNSLTTQTQVTEGGRNVWLTGLAGAIRNRGCGYKTILAALIEGNIECCNPPLEPEEVQMIAKSISKYQIMGDYL